MGTTGHIPGLTKGGAVSIRRARGSHNRGTQTGNRTLPLILCAMALVLSATVVRGQLLEKTLFLPDSLGGLTYPQCLVYDSTNNTIYVGGGLGSCLIAIDGVTDRKIARIQIDQSSCVALCSNPQRNKIYSAGGDSVVVIDAATNQVVANLPSGGSPAALCYSAQDDKVYCANNGGNTITVINGASDSVVATVATGRWPGALCCNPQDNKVYSANELDGDVTVIDCAVDTVTATVPVGDGPVALCYNSTNKKMYCVNSSSSNVTVIDARGDTATATVPAGYAPHALCYNPQNNKIYSANWDGTVTVIDGATDSIVATVTIGDYNAAVCYNPVNDRIYSSSSSEDTVFVIDGATDSIVATVAVGGAPSALYCDTHHNKVYCLNSADNSVTVIDGATEAVDDTIAAGQGARDLAWNPTQNRIYVANSEGSSISVIRDTSAGVGVRSMPQAAGSKPLPTIIHGVLLLPASPSHRVAASTALLDIAGRRVAELHAGANDVSRLAPGVYFVREAQVQAQAVRKVVVTR